MRILFTVLLATMTVLSSVANPAAAADPAATDPSDLFHDNFGVSTVGLSPLARQEFLNIIDLDLQAYTREAALGNLALIQEKQRLSPILNCQAPAASSQAFAFSFASCQVP